MRSRSLLHLAAWAAGILAAMLVSAIAGTPPIVSADTPTPTPTPTATPIPTNTPAPNSAPTLEVLRLSRIDISTRHQSDRAFRLYLGGPASRGAEIPVRLRGRDADGNLDYLAIIDKYGVILDEASCEAGMESECTLVLTMTSPEDWDQIKRVYAVAVDREGASSERTTLGVSTSPEPTPTPTPRPAPTPTPTPRPTPTVPPLKTVSMTVPAGEEAVFEHESGARIEIPDGATVPVPLDWYAGPELTSTPQMASDEIVTVSITEFDTPVPNVLEVESAFEISIVDEDGEDVVLREPVTVTLPFTMPEGKNAADVLVVHWNEHLERWESVDGGVVDEADETVTVEMEHLSGVGVTFFVGPLQFLAMTTASGVDVGTLYSSYEDGYKRALTLHGEVNVPLFFGLGFEGGASLILDVDDILSLGDTKRKYTGEGTGGFFTYGLNGHLAGSFGGAGASGSLAMTKPFTGKRGASRYNNDLSFDASISLLSVSIPGGFLEADFLTFNENGNFDPVDAQINACPICGLSLEVVSGPGAIVKVLDSTVNIAKGEFNTNFEDIVRDLTEGRCGQSRCQMTWSELIELYTKFMVSGVVGLYSLGEKVGLLHDYTDYEHLSPEEAADIGLEYLNKIEGFGGGYDVNGDSVGDMVFPSDQTGGVPLRVLTTGDNLEQKRHFLEVTEITEGWSIEFDPSSTPSDLNAATSTPSEGAVVRVDFDAPALSLNGVHWLVTTTDDAPDAGQITFRLVNNRSGLTDVQLYEVPSHTLWKGKQFSDLSIEAEVDPDPVRTDESVSYTVTVENRGPDSADDVKLTMKSISSLGLSLQQADLSGNSLSCDEPDSLGDLVCELGDIDAGQTATTTLEFTLKPTFPTGTPFTTAFAVTQRVGGSPLPREELTARDNSTTVTALTVSDREALIALYDATDGANWRNNANWLSEEPLDEWFGVETDNRGRVIQLSLVENGLNGQLPPELGDLTELRRVNIGGNPSLTGDIPPEMAQLTKLVVLYLWGNDLTGPVPSWLGNLTNVWLLSLGNNRLTGPIPPELRRLSNLATLYLAGNGLTGSIPDWMGELTGLTRLLLNENSLTGRIPGSLASLEHLEYLHLSGNSLCGSVPANLTDVVDNDLDQLNLMDCGASAERDSEKDIDLLTGAGNTNPTGIWSDGTTMWVTDSLDNKIYAYNLATKARDAAKEFNTLAGAGNADPEGIWSDGATMWVADGRGNKIFAYNLATKARDAAKDFNTLADAGNTSQSGIWSDGTTMWVADWSDDKLYAYNLATKARDESKDFDTLEMEDGGGRHFPLGLWSDDTTMWVADWGADKLYAYNLATKARDAAKEFNTLADAGNTSLYGIWSDGTTMWVADWTDDKLYAYNMATKARDAAKDFDTLDAGNNTAPVGLWSDGTTMWVADWSDGKIYAYNLATKARDAAKDFNTLDAAGNDSPDGIWSDGTTMWVTDLSDDKIYAYNMPTEARDAAKDFDTLDAAGNDSPDGLWSDGTTMWVADWSDGKIYAYNLATKARDAAKDFNTLDAAGNDSPAGVWSDGTTMWVADSVDDKIYAYNMTTKARDAAKDFNTLLAAGNQLANAIWSDGTTMWVTDPSDDKIYAYNMP